MTDYYLLLTPLLVIGVLGLIRFIGCDKLFGLVHVVPSPPTLLDAIPGNQRVDVRWTTSSASVESFTVMYGTASGSYTDEVVVQVTDPSQTLFTESITGLVNGTTYYFVVTAHSGEDTSANSAEKSATPDPGFVLATPTLGPVQRNDIQGFVGMSITVLGGNLVVTHLGRIHLPGNTQSHIVKIVDAATGMDVGSPVTIQIPATPDTENQYVFEPMTETATLLASQTYYVVSEERLGGDLWYDLPNTSTTTNVALLNSGIFKRATDANYSAFGGVNEMYGPVNFRY